MDPPLGPPVAADDVSPAAPPPSRSKKGVLIGAVVAVLALGGAGVFAASQLGDDDGGAGSPEELGEQVMATLENEDVLGLIDLLAPGERDVLRDPLVDFVDELSRLEVLSDAADLAKVAGVDLVLENESVAVATTNVGDVVNVAMHADAEATVDGEQLPIGDLVFDYADDFDAAELDAEDSSDLELEMTAVEIDGRWYLSLGFTAAESIRRSIIDAPDIPETGIEPLGSDTPEGALDAVLEGIESLDVAEIIAALNPGEAAALQRYAPLFLDEVDELTDEVPVELQITESEYTISGSGETRHASIDVLVVEATFEGETATFEYSDGCFVVESQGETVNSCDLAGDDELGDVVGDPEALEELGSLVEDVLGDYQNPGLTLRQTDGLWYFSPVGTMFDQALAVAKALDRDEIDRLIDEGVATFEDVFESMFGTTPFDEPFDDPFDDPFDEPLDFDPPLTIPESVPTSVPFDTVPLDDIDDDWPGNRCYEEVSADVAVACFQTMIAAGVIEPTEVPAEIRFPECGVAQAYIDGYYALGDEEFFALVDTARPCFLDLVARGEIEEYELAYEYTDPDCFEGRNWYAVFDDPEYDDRFWECVVG